MEAALRYAALGWLFPFTVRPPETLPILAFNDLRVL
jgi:hypothetical protein